MLQRGGHDVAAAKSLLSQLESRQARHIVDRNRLFKELADHSSSSGTAAHHGIARPEPNRDTPKPNLDTSLSQS
jgi:hypothetical protein